MKKVKYFLLSLLLLIPVTGKAAIYHCSAPSTAVSGSTFSVRFYGSLSSSSATWSGTIVGTGNASYAGGDLKIWHDGASFDRTVTFKAGNPGEAKFYVGGVDVSDENQEYSGSDTCTVTIVAANSSNSSGNNNRNNNRSNNNANKSGNNNLKKLVIADVTLSPEFDKDTLEYSAVVEGDKEKIGIEAEAEDGKASISGDGEKDLQEGLNEFTISVTAENGSVKEYKLSITRKEKNPIEVVIGKKKYTVLKKETELEVPEGFTKTNIVLEKQDVVAYSNEYTAYILVVLVDEDGNASFYVYDKKNDTYTEYVEFESKNIKLMLMEPKAKDVPYKYKKITFPVDGKVVNGYYLEYKSEFRLVYGMNMSNGDVGFYLYDMNEETFQRFYNVQVETYVDLVKKFKYVSIGIGALTIILFVIASSLLIKNRKLKKKLKNGNIEEPKKEEKKEEPKALTREERLRLKEEQRKELEETKTKKIPEVNEEPKEEKEEIDKKEQKRLAKEEKLKAKEAKRLEKEQAKLAKKEAKAKTIEEPKEAVDKKALKNAQKEMKRLQKEEDKKRKAEADDFLK